ncbi:MAG: NERD domain-containing protein, partial [Chloroflexota bacterium]|nr:NERD domain-containing protein [Chloroflexota bacterium]
MPPVRHNARAARSTLRVVRNAAYVAGRKRLARWSTLIGVAFLGTTFWLATDPALILFAYALMLGGYVLFSFGLRELAKYNARNDLRIETLLKGLGDRYALVHYGQVGKRTVDHTLVYPGGVLVLTARELPGTISYRNGRWRKRTRGFGRLLSLGGPQLGDPSRETQANVDALSAFLTEAGFAVEVDGAIVFLSSQVNLDVEEPDFPVTNADGLPELVRDLPTEAAWRSTDRDALLALFTGGEASEQPVAAPRRRPVKR